MNSSTPLDEANNLIVQRFIRKYLTSGDDNIRTVYGACVTFTRISNRYGVPPDAQTYRYTIWHPDFGFSFDVRAVWRCNDLMRPIAVHTLIEDYEDKADLGDDLAVRRAANDWLQSLPV